MDNKNINSQGRNFSQKSDTKKGEKLGGKMERLGDKLSRKDQDRDEGTVRESRR